MILDQNTITYKGLPLFQRARMTTNSSQHSNMQDLACFFYIVDGKYEATESHGTYKLSEKEALIKRCGNYVARFFDSDSGKNCEAVAIYFFPDVLHEVYKNEVPSFLNAQNDDIPPKKLVPNDLIEKYIESLFTYFQNPDLIDEELALLKLKEFILILLKSEQYKSVQQFLSEIFSPHRLKFTSVIENNVFSNISMEELAFLCNKSLSSFKRDFKKQFGQTPARYIKERRLEHAAKLISSSQDSISAIAYDSGFQDVTTFSASFSAHFGSSPSAYRMSQTRK